MKLIFAFLSLMLCVDVSAVAQVTPVGTWHSIDDQTGKPSGEVKISDKGNGELVGVVVRSLSPDIGKEAPNCTLCTDDRKDKPKIGMEIIRGAKSVNAKSWEGGNILDPNNGKVYRLRLMPLDGGNKLQVRGYIGPFYRTQIWNRVN